MECESERWYEGECESQEVECESMRVMSVSVRVGGGV